jgi:hypothetical protein
MKRATSPSDKLAVYVNSSDCIRTQARSGLDNDPVIFNQSQQPELRRSRATSLNCFYNDFIHVIPQLIRFRLEILPYSHYSRFRKRIIVLVCVLMTFLCEQVVSEIDRHDLNCDPRIFHVLHLFLTEPGSTVAREVQRLIASEEGLTAKALLFVYENFVQPNVSSEKQFESMKRSQGHLDAIRSSAETLR